MKKQILPMSMIVCVVFATVLAASAAKVCAKEITTVKSTDDPSLGILSIIWKIHTFYDKKNELSIRVFETGGGDPAMNGNRIIVVASGSRPGVYPLRIWETGVDVSWVKDVKLLDRTLTLSITEHYFSDDGVRIDTKIRDAIYKLTYDMKTGIMLVQKAG